MSITKNEIQKLRNYFESLNKNRCVGCGKCCTQKDKNKKSKLLISKQEIKEIKNKFSSQIKKIKKELNTKNLFVKNRIKCLDGQCVFMDENNRCKIYPLRPILCVGYPSYMTLFGNKPVCRNGIKFPNIDEKIKRLFQKYYSTLKNPNKKGV